MNLCDDCKFSIVRKMEDKDDRDITLSLNKCLIDNCFVEKVVKCNRHEKEGEQVSQARRRMS
jgi:hypothetical protein